MESIIKTSAFLLLSFFTTLTIADNQGESSLLWKISGPDLPQPSYILGTIHIMCAADRKADPRLASTMNQVEQLIVELTVDTPEKNAQMMSAMVNDQPLVERLSSIQYAQLSEIIEKHTDFDIKLFNNMEMFAISAALLVSSFDCPIVGVEEGLEAMAKEKGMPIGELESIEEQISVLKAMEPPKRDGAWTEQEMKAFGMFPDMFQAILSAYYSEDIDAIYQLIIEQLQMAENSAELSDAVLDARNMKWVAKMPAIMEKKPTLFAVGAGHLGGPNGVINLLKKAGFEITPVYQATP